MALPIIAIVGRPNVGKSTLFNRLIGKRYAITSPVPGTTRDRIYHEAEIGTYNVILVDTGGMEFDKKQDIEADVQLQAKLGVEEADIIYFVVDTTQPLTASDLDAAQFLRRSKKQIILIAHKADNEHSKTTTEELYALGFGEAVSVSSIHNMGLEELDLATEKVLKKLKWKKEKPHKKDGIVRIAIVGRPNVGKSSFVNALLGENRLIVSDKPGTTIDATDTPFKCKVATASGSANCLASPRLGLAEDNFILIDTAGLRRRGKVGQGIEKYGVLRALQAVSRADVACLMLDATDKIANQDLHVSEYILEAGKGLIVIVNKTDLMEDKQKDQEKLLGIMQYRMGYMPWAPVVFVSAKDRKNIFKVLESAKNIAAERNKKISDEEFAVFVKTIVVTHPPSHGSHKIVFYKGKQTGFCPPTFTFEVNKPDFVHFSYRRFLENEIRRKFGFYGTAIRLQFVIKFWD